MAMNGFGRYILPSVTGLATLAIATAVLTWRDVGANTAALSELGVRQAKHLEMDRQDHDAIVSMQQCIRDLKEDVSDLKAGQKEILKEIRSGR